MSATHTLATTEGRAALAAQYRDALLGDVIPFWLRHGMDSEHGGIFTALDRDGSVTDTDKSVWFQGRAAWMFATLFNPVERRDGSVSSRAKGSMWKGPFHLPRCLWHCSRLLAGE